MSTHPSLWSFIINADIVVKAVLMILLTASVLAWTVIIQRTRLLKATQRQMADFEQQFWSGIELHDLQQTINNPNNPIAAIFCAGFKEFSLFEQHNNKSPQTILGATERAMQIAHNQQLQPLEQNLGFLATVGSTSPYIGLFGTVWGIIAALHALGTAQQATIAMVAPGISEALIATAIGLFAAIPAVIAYNRFNHQLQNISDRLENFQQAFINILQRQI